MAGRPGRGGQNRIPLETHVLRGTFKPYKHAARIPDGAVWDPPPGAIEALGDAGRAFVVPLHAIYRLNPIEGPLALEGGHAVDRLADIRARRRRATVAERTKLDRQELQWTRAFANVLLALRGRLVRAPAAAPPVSKWGTGL